MYNRLEFPFQPVFCLQSLPRKAHKAGRSVGMGSSFPTASPRHPKAGTMQKLLAQIMKFGVVGVIATVIDFGIMNLLHYGLGLNILIANTSGFIISLIFNYLASMKYVVAHKEGMSRRREFIIFVVLSVIGLVLNDGIVLALNAGLGLEANIAKICATALVMVYNFVTRKIFLEGDETK